MTGHLGPTIIRCGPRPDGGAKQLWESAIRVHARALILILTAILTGCTAISVAPTCPEELQVGESGAVAANEVNPGAIPKYHWSVIPSDAGTFEASDQPSTTFTAAKAGDAVLRITAADGIYMVQADCDTLVVEAIVVSLDAQPPSPTAGDLVTLTCSSDNSAVTDFMIVQTDGTSVELADGGMGIATFTPQDAGTLGFECTGSTAAGTTSDPAAITITVAASGGGRNPRG